MVRFSIETIKSLMGNPNNIRNFSVIAHVDHGKSTLVDSLLFSNEIISRDDVGNKRATDTRPDEAQKGITIKSTGVSLHYELPENVIAPPSSKGRQFLINLIDSPGHADFSSEVTAALRLTDGALVLVDCVEGSCAQTEVVLRQALAERIKPVLAVNKLDRAFTQLQLNSEEMYQTFSKWISSVNDIIGSFQDQSLGDLTVHPAQGTVCFSAGKQGWSFTLRQFARFYSDKYKKSEDDMVEILWGDHFYDPDIKKWTTCPISESGKPLKRGFCQLILEPIRQVFEACLVEGQDSKLDKILSVLKITIPSEERAKKGEALLKSVMLRWLPASDAILEMIVKSLPSPVMAQKYRVETLYTGPLDDSTAEAIRNCDPNGPLVMYISKMIPSDKDNSRFMAFGRVFSGTVTCQKVRVMGPNYVPGQKEDLATNQSVQRVNIVMGGKVESVDQVTCGNTCALVGIDSVLSKTGTITSDESSHPLVNMKYSVSPVVRVSVSCKNASELPKLLKALGRLAMLDTLVQIKVEDTGEITIAASGDLHLEILISDLRGLLKDVELIVSQPVVPFQETISGTSSIKCLAKSPNGHNRLYASAEPLAPALVTALNSGEVHDKDPKLRASILSVDYGWDLSEARKIWAFGPLTSPLNTIVDITKGHQYINEVKDSIVMGFQHTANKGVLTEEPLQGVRFNILDVNLHADAIHRGAGQILPTTRRVLCASQYTAQPRLLEPMYLATISCNDRCLGDVYNALHKKRAEIIEAVPKHMSSTVQLYEVKAYLPVDESFDFSGFLRGATSGQAFPQLVFDHWRKIDDDPFVDGSRSNLIVKKVRERKGIEANIPPLERYLDKL